MKQDEAVRAPAMSFIVRMWKDDYSIPEMRGEVEYIATGEKRLFISYWSLLSLIEAWRQDLEAAR